MNDATKPATGTATVTVACKLPHGLLCRVHKEVEQEETIPGGTRKIKLWFPTGEEFRLNGNAYPQNVGPKVPIEHGFALTHGVPKDLWDAWLKQNRMLPAVREGMIFAQGSAAKAVDEAKEKKGIRTGFERLDPNNLPAEFSQIKTADEQKAEIAKAA
jgi:hypothetical protein